MFRHEAINFGKKVNVKNDGYRLKVPQFTILQMKSIIDNKQSYLTYHLILWKITRIIIIWQTFSYYTYLFFPSNVKSIKFSFITIFHYYSQPYTDINVEWVWVQKFTNLKVSGLFQETCLNVKCLNIFCSRNFWKPLYFHHYKNIHAGLAVSLS